MTRPKNNTPAKVASEESTHGDSETTNAVEWEQLTQLRSLYDSTRVSKKQLENDLLALRSLHAETWKKLEKVSDSNAAEISEQVQIIRGIKGLPHGDKEYCGALASEYGNAAATFNENSNALKQAAEALLALAQSIGHRRSQQLAAAYDGALKSATTALLVFSADKEEAESLARTASGIFSINERIVGWQPFAIDPVSRALGVAGAVLAEMDQPIPAFS